MSEPNHALFNVDLSNVQIDELKRLLAEKHALLDATVRDRELLREHIISQGAERERLKAENANMDKLLTSMRKELLSLEDRERLRKSNHLSSTKPLTVATLVTYAHATAIEKGWYDNGPRPLPELLCLVHSEVSEALEELRNGHEPGEVYYRDGKPEGFGIELADVYIRVADMAGAYGIDLESCVETKLAFNSTREKRHGGKKL